MKIRVVLEFDSETNSYSVSCPELPGCTSAGDTEETALENIKEAIALFLEPSPIKIKDNAKIVELEVAD